MPDGIISTDIVGNVTYMNPAAESLTGWKLSEAKRMVLQDVFSVNNGLGDEVLFNLVIIKLAIRF